MKLPPLQVIEPEMPPEWAIVFQQSTDVLSALIGLFIAYQAYRGYRRNGSRPMLFIAIGFVLVLAIPFLVFVLYATVPFLSVTVTVVITQFSKVLGLLAVLYALRMPT